MQNQDLTPFKERDQLVKHWSLSVFSVEDNTVWESIDGGNTGVGNTGAGNTGAGSTDAGSTDGENKTGADYKTLENNQTGSIDGNRWNPLPHILLHPIPQFQETPSHLLARYSSPLMNCRK